jgi:hypothetical protein
MGYLAITSKIAGIVVDKTSETIFIERGKTYCFFEFELKSKEGGQLKSGKYVVSIIIPGRVKHVANAGSVVHDPCFVNWYYSQKKITTAGTGMRIFMNDYFTRIVSSEVDAQYDRRNRISTVNLSFDYEATPEEPVTSIHTFFTFACRGNVIIQRGNIYAESRYFDKKLCPKGDYFHNVVLGDNILEVNRIYCWFVIPKGFLASDYTSFPPLVPRDAHIAEKEYNILLNGRSRIKRWGNKIADKFFGRPQVVNWRVEQKNITFFRNYQDIGKWDEIRLFVSCSGFPLRVFFLYFAGIASIVGALLTMIIMD